MHFSKLILRVVACLLLAMVVAAALDTIPDPPAIQFSAKQTSLISQLHFDVTIEPHEMLRCAAPPELRIDPFSCLVSSEPKRQPEFVFVRHATDSSPPCFS